MGSKHGVRAARKAVTWAAACALAGGGLAGTAVLTAGPALAATGDPSCANGACSVTFATVGTGQSFTVPAGVSSLSVSLYGAVGGGGTPGSGFNPGGDGAEVTATLAVGAGQTIGVDVGGAGGLESAADGGTNGGGGATEAGGGGGSTDITSDGTPLLVAGGGGGAGGGLLGGGEGSGCPAISIAGGPGGNADTAGGVGQTFENGTLSLGGGQGGFPGTQTAPGAGGAGGTLTGTDPCAIDAGLPSGTGKKGASGNGGNGGGGVGDGYNGAGGGGYYGGGSGGEGAASVLYDGGGGGGGGGSSYTGGSGVTGGNVDDTGNPYTGTGQVNGGNGQAVLSWPDQVSAGAPSFTGTQGQTLDVSAAGGLLSTATDAIAGDTLTASTVSSPESTTAGGSVTVNADGSFSYTPPSATFTGADTFAYTVTDAATGDYATGTATVNVQPAAVAPMVTVVSAPASAATGTPYSAQFTVTGTPAPTVTLGAGAPSWLSVTSAGAVTGTPPAGTKSFSYHVVAANSAGSATSATVTVAVSDQADVRAALACPASLAVGAAGTCTLTVANAGPALATDTGAGAVVTGPLQVTGCSGHCSDLLGIILGWSLGSLPAGQSVTLTIDVTGSRAGTAVVAAADAAASPDPDLLDNIAAATVKVTK